MNKTLHTLKNIVLIILLIISLLVFIFALFSGATEPGVMGIIKNSPNALPWLILLIIIGIAWKWELIGGIILALFSVFTLFFFDAFEEPFVLLIITLPLLIGGIILILSSRDNKEHP